MQTSWLQAAFYYIYRHRSLFCFSTGAPSPLSQSLRALSFSLMSCLGVPGGIICSCTSYVEDTGSLPLRCRRCWHDATLHGRSASPPTASSSSRTWASVAHSSNKAAIRSLSTQLLQTEGFDDARKESLQGFNKSSENVSFVCMNPTLY